MTMVIHAFKDALTITAFVGVMMLVIEYVNILTQGVWEKHLVRNRWGQYVLAAFLGATPGCLGAFTVVGLYSHGLLTRGAVIAAMIATMGDESFVMLAMLPKQGLLIMGLMLVIGVGVGALSDTLARRWMPQESPPCEALELHTQPSCRCFPRDLILRQWRECSPARGILAASLSLFLLGLAFGHLGPPEWNWLRVTLLLTSAVALFITTTVPDHFLEDHLWNHVVRKHVPKIFLWTLGALVVMSVLTEQLYFGEALQHGKWLLLVSACLVGLIPESGPHLIFLTLYAQGSLPFSVLLAGSIVQDGHGMLPMLAHSQRAFFGIKLVNFLAGLLIGSVALCFGW